MPILCIVGFLSAVWLAGKVSKLIGISSIVLEILVGLIFAPGVVLEHGLLDAAGGHNADMFVLIGHAGVAMMIFESGMHFDFEQAKKVGHWACLVAIGGTFFPIFAGMFLTQAFGSPLYPDGLAVGVSLAPTSVGIALKLLMEAKCLHKNFGQAIITAAFVDDILSLVAFNVLFSVTAGPINLLDVVGKPVIGIVFMLAAGSLGLSFWPKMVTKLEHLTIKGGSRTLHDECLLLLLFGLLVGYGTFTHFLGTHLWGCFVAGMSFAMVHHAHHVWTHQTKRITRWMLRIFFSCTVAFAIPFDTLFTLESFWKGSVMGIVACVSTKVICAIFMGETRWVIGWAMVGRAEFAYLIAEMAVTAHIMTPEVFSIVIWALLYATIFAPFVFRKVLARYAEKLKKLEEVALADGKPANNKSDEACGFRFEISHPKGEHCNLQDAAEVGELLKQFKMIITHSVQHSDEDKNYSIFQVQTEDGETLAEDALEYLKKQIAMEFVGTDAKLTFLPSNGREFMTQNTAKLDAETLGAVEELIQQVSNSKMPIDADTIREISFNLGRDRKECRASEGEESACTNV